MDKDIKQLEISSSSDSVSEKSESSSGDAYAWRMCLKNVERNDIPAADVQASDPDGQAAKPEPSKVKTSKDNVDVAMLSPETEILGFSEEARRKKRSFISLKERDPQLHDHVQRALASERVEAERLLAAAD